MNRRRVLLGTAAMIASRVAGQSQENDGPTISIVRLISTPESFDGRNISVIGYLWLGQGATLFFSETDGLYSVVTNSIAIDLTERQRERARDLQGTYVIITGRYAASKGQRSEYWNGRISDVTELKEWIGAHNRKQKLQQRGR